MFCCFFLTLVGLQDTSVMTLFLHFTMFFKISVVSLIQNQREVARLVSVIHCKNVHSDTSPSVQ